MSGKIAKHITSPRMAISLAAALLQGLLLLWLHTRIQEENWPADSPPWLAALYAVGMLVPITLHLLSEHWRAALLWFALAVLGAVLFYFGWHFGAQVGNPLAERPIEGEAGSVFALSLVLLWLLFLPFLRARLVTGRWRCGYAQLFALAWQNKLALAEAGLFTGVLWLLLFLWAALFKMLGYDFFESFFEWPGFVYPFTAVAFGVALYLVGSVERIVTVAREQLLGLLKWLMPVAALILALFAPTLLVKLPGLVFSGEHAISAAWLLWLIAITVLLLNTAYQNGLVEKPYPAPLALALRIVVPAMLIVAGTALYSMYVRVLEYGITVPRVFAMVVALAAMIYAVGYTLAALRRGPWMRGIERVNTGLALALIALIAAMLTPLVSPYRLAAASQYGRALESADDFKTRDSALRYLRFESGRYGMRALQRLADAQNTAVPPKVREHAARVQGLEHRWSQAETRDRASKVKIEVFPTGRALESELEQAMRAELKTSHYLFNQEEDAPPPKVCAVYADMDGDAVEEGVLLYASNFSVFTRRETRWVEAGSGDIPGGECDAPMRESLVAGNYSVLMPKWRDLKIGERLLRMRNIVADKPPR